MSDLDLGKRLRVTSDHIETVVDGETVLMQHTTGTFFSLEATARAAWALLGDGLTGDEVIDRLAATYRSPRETVAADTVPFLEQLVEHGLVALDPDGT